MNLPELPWIAEARKHVGQKEIKGPKHNPVIMGWIKYLRGWFTNDETPWCGTFVAYCLTVCGIGIPKHWYRALDYLNYGTPLPKPAYGCVAIKTRKGGGHVCFVVGKTPDGRLVCLGGNQSDMVCYAIYRVTDFEQFRWYGKSGRPADGRYTLPVITNITRTSVTEA